MIVCDVTTREFPTGSKKEGQGEEENRRPIYRGLEGEMIMKREVGMGTDTYTSLVTRYQDLQEPEGQRGKLIIS